MLLLLLHPYTAKAWEGIKAPRDKRISADPEGDIARRIPHHRITTRTTLLHTQASDRHPAQAGFFLAGSQGGSAQGFQAGSSRGDRDRGGAQGGLFKKGEAARVHPMKLHRPCPSGMHRPARREISWGPRRGRLANRTGSVSRRWSSQSRGRGLTRTSSRRSSGRSYSRPS